MNITDNKQFEDILHFGKKNRQRYLNETDWRVIKCLETGAVEDQEVKDKRQQARDEISLIRIATNYEEIEHLTIEFN